MSTPAIIDASLVALHFVVWAVRRYRRHRRFMRWLERDAAMTQAFHDYIAIGNFEEARELRQEAKHEFEQHFKP